MTQKLLAELELPDKLGNFCKFMYSDVIQTLESMDVIAEEGAVLPAV